MNKYNKMNCPMQYDKVPDDCDIKDCPFRTVDKENEINGLKINLNDFVKFKLTDYGKDIYYHQYDKINEHCNKNVIQPSMPEVDKNGYSTMQLWDFMRLYGKYIGMGLPNVIEPLNIIKVEENQTKS